MTQDQYLDWYQEVGSVSRQARLLRSISDPFMIMGFPSGDKQQGYIEGIVVISESAQYPFGYVSFAWRRQSFEFAHGTLGLKLLNLRPSFSSYTTPEALTGDDASFSKVVDTHHSAPGCCPDCGAILLHTLVETVCPRCRFSSRTDAESAQD